MIVNPNHFLNAIDTSFGKYMEQIEKNESYFYHLRCALLRDFQKDVEYANRC